MSKSTKSVALAALALVGLPALLCPEIASARPEKNVILILLDDSSWDDWPFLNPPLQWDAKDNPLTSATNSDSNTNQTREGRLFVPDLNRLGARMLSETNGDIGRSLTNSSDYVVPVDLDFTSADTTNTNSSSNVANFKYAPQTNCTATNADPRKSASGCSSQKDVLTGFGGLGRLARNGVSFTRFYATSALCSPTRASIFSGRYPHENGVEYNFADLNLEASTIAKVLYDQGYKTGHLGKWHIGSKGPLSPSNRGWEMTLWDKSSARKHWSTAQYECNGPPADKYCTKAASFSSTCTTNANCDGCAYVENKGYFCYDKTPASCTTNATCGSGETCEPWGEYLGADNRIACHPEEYDFNPDCCIPSTYGSSTDGTYKFGAKRGYLQQCSNNAPCDTNADCSSGACAFKNFCSNSSTSCTSNNDCGYEECRSNHCLNSTNFAQTCTTNSDCGRSVCLHKLQVGRCQDTPTTCATNSDCSGVGNKCIANPFWFGDNKQENPDNIRFICNNDSDRGCAYDTRHFANRAIDFIHKNRREKFFLSMSLHAVHHPASAPARTEAHYLTGLKLGIKPSGQRPGEGIMVWAAIEEVDAAIGRIMQALTDEGLNNDTVILFTADQGRSKNNFGSPTLAGGKNQTLEGGIRIPFIIWSGALTGGETSRLGSQVDLLPTIAAAANLNVSYVGSTCKNSNPPVACDDDSDCGGAECEKVSGRSLLARCVGGTDAGEVCSTNGDCSGGSCGALTNRDFVYAWMSGDRRAIISREGYYWDKCAGNADCAYMPGVCGFASSPSVASPSNASPSNVRHTIRGTSDIPCLTNGDCDDVGDDCTISGKVCYNGSTQNADAMEHCESREDCKNVTNADCVERTYQCNQCLPAMWKARSGTAPLDDSLTELYDLTSNPEEDPTANLFNSNADCAGMTANSPEQKLCNVQADLKCRLARWWNGGNPTSDGEPLEDRTSCCNTNTDCWQ